MVVTNLVSAVDLKKVTKTAYFIEYSRVGKIRLDYTSDNISQNK